MRNNSIAVLLVFLGAIAAPIHVFASGEAEAGAPAMAGSRGIGPAPATVNLRLDDVKTVDGLMEGYYENELQVAFGTFTYEYTGLSSNFSRYLEEALASLIAKSEKLRLFNRNVAAAMDPAFRDVYKDFFESNQVGGLLSGRFFDEGDQVRVRIELTNLRDGNLVGTGDLSRLKTELPPRLYLEPGKETQATAASVANLISSATPTVAALPTVPVAPAAAPAAKPAIDPQTSVSWSYQSLVGGLSVAVSTDRGPGASYSDGEKMVCYVSVNKEAYVKIYHIDVTGKIQLIWPNRFGGSGTLSSGAPVTIPAPTDPFEFTLGPPYGTEFIKVVASTKPFDTTEADFDVLSGSAKSVIDRGLTVTAAVKPATASKPTAAAAALLERAEALASYYIGPKVTTKFEVK